MSYKKQQRITEINGLVVKLIQQHPFLSQSVVVFVAINKPTVSCINGVMKRCLQTQADLEEWVAEVRRKHKL